MKSDIIAPHIKKKEDRKKSSIVTYTHSMTNTWFYLDSSLTNIAFILRHVPPERTLSMWESTSAAISQNISNSPYAHIRLFEFILSTDDLNGLSLILDNCILIEIVRQIRANFHKNRSLPDRSLKFGANVVQYVLCHIRARPASDLAWYLHYSRWRPKMAAEKHIFANNSKVWAVRA